MLYALGHFSKAVSTVNLFKKSKKWHSMKDFFLHFGRSVQTRKKMVLQEFLEYQFIKSAHQIMGKKKKKDVIIYIRLVL